MEKDYQRLSKTLKKPAVPTGLQDLVLAHIDSEIARLSRIRLAIFVPLMLVSSVGVVLSFQYLAQVASQSGFSSYLSIIFSDGRSVLSFWKELLLSLAEQAPVLETSLFLGALLALVSSFRKAISSTQTMYYSTKLAF